jgi:hypothetical protein
VRYDETLDAADRAEFERLTRTLGTAKAERAEHLVFSRYVLKDQDVGTPLYWRDVLQALRDAVRDERRH